MAVALASSDSFPDLPEVPHQPTTIEFPKRAYGKKKIVRCSFQSHWFSLWPFLHYSEASDVVFCHTCVKAFKLKRMKTSHNAASAFVSLFSHDAGYPPVLRLLILHLDFKGLL